MEEKKLGMELESGDRKVATESARVSTAGLTHLIYAERKIQHPEPG